MQTGIVQTHYSLLCVQSGCQGSTECGAVEQKKVDGRIVEYSEMVGEAIQSNMPR